MVDERDAGQLQFLVTEPDLRRVLRELARLGFRRRYLGPHRGQAAGFVRELADREQLHAVLYPDRSGFLISAHCEPSERRAMLAHLTAHLLRRPADYERGRSEMERCLRLTSLPYEAR